MHVHLTTAQLILPLSCPALIAIIALYRNRLRYLRPFGAGDSESLMNLARRGTLHCLCVATDAAEPHNERRRSCRACGNAIVASDPTRLYETLSAPRIRLLTLTLQRAAIEARTLPAHVPNPTGRPAIAELP